MTVDVLRDIALALPGTTEDIKWDTHLCFCINKKIYLITSPDVVPSPASFKVPEEDFYEVISIDGFSKNAYLGRYFWIHLDDISRLNKKEWEKYITQSYKLIASKLSAKFRKQIGL